MGLRTPDAATVERRAPVTPTIAALLIGVAGALIVVCSFLPWVTIDWIDAPTDRYTGWTLVEDGGAAYHANGQGNWFFGEANQVTWDWGELITGPGAVVSLGGALVGVGALLLWRQHRRRDDDFDRSARAITEIGLGIALVSFLAAVGNLTALSIGASAKTDSGLTLWLLASAAAVGASIWAMAIAGLPPPSGIRPWPAVGALLVSLLALPADLFALFHVVPVLAVVGTVLGWRAVERSARLGRVSFVIALVALGLGALGMAGGQ